MGDNLLRMGNKLPNGAEVVDTRKAPNGQSYVLAFLPGNTVTPWVSWQYHWDDTNDEYSTYWGNYYEDLESGVRDFRSRGAHA